MIFSTIQQLPLDSIPRNWKLNQALRFFETISEKKNYFLVSFFLTFSSITLRSEGTPAETTSSSGQTMSSAISQHNSEVRPTFWAVEMKIAKHANELASDALTCTLEA